MVGSPIGELLTTNNTALNSIASLDISAIDATVTKKTEGKMQAAATPTNIDGHAQGYYSDSNSVSSAEGVDMDVAKMDPATLRARIKAQVEYYFSQLNLSRDVYMKSQMGPDGFIAISIIAAFKKVRKLTADQSMIVEAISGSTICALNDEKTALKATWKRPARTTVILREMPDSTLESEVKELFNGEGEFKLVSVRADVGNTWFVEFESEEGSKNAVVYLADKTFKGERVKARLKSENVLRSSAPTWKPTGALAAAMAGGAAGYGFNRPWEPNAANSSAPTKAPVVPTPTTAAPNTSRPATQQVSKPQPTQATKAHTAPAAAAKNNNHNNNSTANKRPTNNNHNNRSVHRNNNNSGKSNVSSVRPSKPSSVAEATKAPVSAAVTKNSESATSTSASKNNNSAASTSSNATVAIADKKRNETSTKSTTAAPSAAASKGANNNASNNSNRPNNNNASKKKHTTGQANPRTNNSNNATPNNNITPKAAKPVVFKARDFPSLSGKAAASGTAPVAATAAAATTASAVAPAISQPEQENSPATIIAVAEASPTPANATDAAASQASKAAAAKASSWASTIKLAAATSPVLAAVRPVAPAAAKPVASTEPAAAGGRNAKRASAGSRKPAAVSPAQSGRVAVNEGKGRGSRQQGAAARQQPAASVEAAPSAVAVAAPSAVVMPAAPRAVRGWEMPGLPKVVASAKKAASVASGEATPVPTPSEPKGAVRTSRNNARSSRSEKARGNNGGGGGGRPSRRQEVEEVPVQSSVAAVTPVVVQVDPVAAVSAPLAPVATKPVGAWGQKSFVQVIKETVHKPVTPSRSLAEKVGGAEEQSSKEDTSVARGPGSLYAGTGGGDRVANMEGNWRTQAKPSRA